MKEFSSSIFSLSWKWRMNFLKKEFICDDNNILLGAHVLGEAAGDIVDFVEIGKPFAEVCLKEMALVRTSPSYYDVFEKLGNQYNFIHTIANM